MTKKMSSLIDDFVSSGNIHLRDRIISMLLHRITKSGSDLKLLMLCLMYDSIDLLDLFITNGVNAYDVDNEGNAIIHFVCISGNVELLNYLIDNKLDANMQNKSGQTPIMQAIKASRWSCVDRLLDCCNLEIKDKNGKSVNDWIIAFCHNEKILRRYVSSCKTLKAFDWDKLRLDCQRWRNDLALRIINEA